MAFPFPHLLSFFSSYSSHLSGIVTSATISQIFFSFSLVLCMNFIPKTSIHSIFCSPNHYLAMSILSLGNLLTLGFQLLYFIFLDLCFYFALISSQLILDRNRAIVIILILSVVFILGLLCDLLSLFRY